MRNESRHAVAVLVLASFMINISGAEKCFKVFNKNRRKTSCNQLIEKDVSFDDCCLKYKGAGYSKGNSRKNCKPCRVSPYGDVWGSWSECNVSCGKGIQTRVRTCRTNAKCTGTKNETKPCQESPCPVDGGWDVWSNWSACSITCGNNGYHRRGRRCINPKPAYGGKRCKGKAEMFKKCEDIPVNCPIDGQWGAWGRWNICVRSSNSSCLGTQTRTRLCDSPPPQYGGEECDDSGAQDESYCKITTADCDDDYGSTSSGSTSSGSSGSSGSFIDADDDTEGGEDYVLDEPH